MKYIGRLLGFILLGINAIVAILMFLSAYSPSIDPHAHPVVSCMGLFFPVLLLVNVFFFIFWAVVYWRFIIFPLLALVVCWGSIRTYFPINLWGEDPPEEAIKIMSYNTRGFGDMKPHTNEHPNEVLAYLQNSDADIICLQEYIFGGKLKKKDIEYALREYRYKHYLSLGNGLNGLGCYSRYPILSATPILYKGTRNGSIAYRIKVDSDTLLVINNHLESNKILKSDVVTYQEMIDTPNKQNLHAGLSKLLGKMAEATSIRAKQADVLLETIKNSKEKAVVFCGDFNDTPISYTHHVFSDELKDAFVETGNGLGVSYNKDRLYVRIDHILVSKNLKVYDCTVDNTIKASDHYPVWCYISLQ